MRRSVALPTLILEPWVTNTRRRMTGTKLRELADSLLYLERVSEINPGYKQSMFVAGETPHKSDQVGVTASDLFEPYFSRFCSCACLRLFLASSKLGASTNDFSHASIALSHASKRL